MDKLATGNSPSSITFTHDDDDDDDVECLLVLLFLSFFFLGFLCNYERRRKKVTIRKYLFENYLVEDDVTNEQTIGFGEFSSYSIRSEAKCSSMFELISRRRHLRSRIKYSFLINETQRKKIFSIHAKLSRVT